MKTRFQRLFIGLLSVITVIGALPLGVAAAAATPNSYISQVVITGVDPMTGNTVYRDSKQYNSNTGADIEWAIPSQIWSDYNVCRFTATVYLYNDTANRHCITLAGNVQPWRDCTPRATQNWDVLFQTSDLHSWSDRTQFSAQFVYRNPSTFESSNERYVSINFVKEELRNQPTGVGYDSTAHRLTGLNSTMEFRYKESSWSSWYTFSSGSNLSYNMYPHLSTGRTTDVEVRYKATGSQGVSYPWTYTIPRLDAAPSGLYIDWYNDTPALFGLDSSRYYALSKTRDFSSYSYINSGSSAILINDLVSNPGDVIYVRSAIRNGLASSYWVALTVPAKPTVTPPNASYDNPTHTLYNLQATMDFRVSIPAGNTGWIQVPANNAYFNVYPLLSDSYAATIETRYRATPAAVQTINIPQLAPAPSGLSLEWLDGVGLIMWGLTSGNYYDFGYDSAFDSWYSTDGSYAGINITPLGLQPGDSLYVRSAPSTTAATSACVQLIVPAMNAPASAAKANTDNLDIGDEFNTVDPNSVKKPNGDQIASENGELLSSDASDAQSNSAVKAQSASTLDIGTVEDQIVSSDAEPIVSVYSEGAFITDYPDEIINDGALADNATTDEALIDNAATDEVLVDTVE